MVRQRDKKSAAHNCYMGIALRTLRAVFLTFFAALLAARFAFFIVEDFLDLAIGALLLPMRN